MDIPAIMAVGAGFQDGFNPCVLMTCAIFILWGMGIDRHVTQVARLRLFFILIYAVGVLFFNFGPVSVFFFKKSFIFMAKVVYFVLGLCSFLVGVWFLKDWFHMPKGQKEVSPLQREPGAIGVVICLTFILVVFLSMLATLWPVNRYIAVLGLEGFVKGYREIILFLIIYTLASLWSLWFLWAFLSVKNIRPSLIKIVCGSVFFTASSSVIFIFR